jgi:hypothetical protein
MCSIHSNLKVPAAFVGGGVFFLFPLRSNFMARSPQSRTVAQHLRFDTC